MQWVPTVATTGYTTVSFTLNTGTDQPGQNVEAPHRYLIRRCQSPLGAITFNNNDFPLASGVGLHVDNVLLTSLISGDANGDDHVDLTDLSIVLNNFGSTTSLRTNGNFDAAPTIDLTDLSDVLNNFGAIAPGASTVAAATNAPEPASAAAMAAGTLLLLRRRKIVRK